MNAERLIRHIEEVKGWGFHRGKTEYLRHLEGGKPLSYKQMVMAKCYECNAGYPDGRSDCGISHCPLYSKMPFKGKKIKNEDE